MSEQLKNNAGKRKLRTTLLSIEWKTSSNGELTTINRELAIQMAKHPNVEVSVFLPQCSEEDKKDADSYNVTLIEAVELSGFEPVDWLASVPEGHAMDCVIGHGVALGRQIQLIKRNPNYSHCKWIQVVHTAPEEIGMFKIISEGQQMQQTEIELCEMADQVVTIGPKLTDVYKHKLRTQDVFNLTPSIFMEFSDVQQASDEMIKFCVLVTESGNSEDFDVKGYRIAAKAIAELKDKSYRLKFASKQRGKEDELADKLLQCGIGHDQLIICSFDENRETLANLFSEVDIAILPSITEGFGLSALEAISAGLPVLVSGNTGIAEALREVPIGSQCIVNSEDPAAWASAIKAVRDRKRNVRLEEAKILRDKYLQKFDWEKSCNFLVKKMYNLAFDPKLNIKVDVDHVKCVDHDAHSAASVSALEPTGYQQASTASGRKRKRQSDTDLEDPQALKGKTLRLIAVNYLATTPPQSMDEHTKFLEYLQKMNVLLAGSSVGSLVITVKCDSLKSLEGLWEDYSCGLLEKMVQDCFVTDKILRELNLAELKLKTTMDIEEYNACKLFFLERDSLRGIWSLCQSSTSDWKGKLEKLHWESQQMKGIWSLCQSSTSDWKGKLEKLLWESQQMKGIWSLCQSSTSDRKGKLEKLHWESQQMKGIWSLCQSSTSDWKGKLEKLHWESQKMKGAVEQIRFASRIYMDITPSVILTGVDNNTLSMPLQATQTSDMKGGVPVETRGWNPLHSAAEGGKEVIIETLLSSGLDIDSRGNDGTTPLMVAAAKGQEKTVDLLLSKGADPFLKNFMGRNLLHAAAEGGNSSIVRSMLSCNIDINSKDDESSATPLIIAVMHNHVEVAKYLLQKGADISLTTESNKSNALHIASQYGSVEAMEMLLSYDLSPDSRDGEGNTPLAYAAACGQIEAVNCLLKHRADPSLKGKNGWSILHFAAQSGNVIIIETMLSEGLDIDSRGETLGFTPLMVCIKFGQLKAAKYLLEKGADESLKTALGRISLLSLASAAGSIAAIEILLSHGCNIDSRDSRGDTPLMHAARLGNTEVLEYLLAKGANPLLRNTSDLGLLHLAALSDNVLTIKAVLSKNLDINARYAVLGITPLLFCLTQGKLEAANYLLAVGADEYLKSKDGLTVLSAAAISGNVAAIEMLLKRGHNPNSRDGCDNTPLMWAAEMGKKEAVEYLLPLTH